MFLSRSPLGCVSLNTLSAPPSMVAALTSYVNLNKNYFLIGRYVIVCVNLNQVNTFTKVFCLVVVRKDCENLNMVLTSIMLIFTIFIAALWAA